jgi:Zn-dependent protease
LAELTLGAAAPPCGGCGTEIAPGLLGCPGCGRLVHAARLQQLAAEAERAEAAGDRAGARTLWDQALALLPPDTRQHEAIVARMAALPRTAEPTSTWRGPSAGWGAGAGAAALLLWKLKFVVVFVLTKAKLLLLGFTKLGTFSSMLLSFGAYWGIYGWPFAAGMVLSIYVHEMGHVAALRGYGVRATAPMFIPGVGAYIRAEFSRTTPAEEARVGLAGPLWGLGAAVVAYAAFMATGLPILAGIARWGALINLFNLTPVWQLDGGHAFKALTRNQRAYAAAAVLAAWLATREGMLFLPLALAVWQIFRPAPREEDVGVLGMYVLLIAALSALFFLTPGLPV